MSNQSINTYYFLYNILIFISIIGQPLKEPRLAVSNVLDIRKRQIIIEAKESGTKQLDTELTDRLDL